MKTNFRQSVAVATFLLIIISSNAQDSDPGKERPASEKKILKDSPKESFVTLGEAKPFKILSSGKRITIQSKSSNNNLKRLLVWTSSGHRIVEQHNLDVSLYVFTISVKEKIFFLMLEMKNGKRYTEKFGIE